MSERFSDTRAFEVASFKALGDNKGQFEALVSIFGNVDRGGDRVVKGAFAKTLARWEESGDPIPVIWNHMWDNPEAHIGAVDPGDAVETADGLLVKGRLDLDNPFARQVHRLLSERRVKEFSFGYNVLDSQKGKDGAFELHEIDLFEVGPTLKGMNPATELLAVKALAVATSPEPVALVEEDGGPQIHETQVVSPAVLPAPVVAPIESKSAEFKAGARLSKETRSALARIRDELNTLLSSAEAEEEPAKSNNEAEAQGKASDVDAELRTRINLLRSK